MKAKFSFLLALLALALTTGAKKVHTIGDSTMANYDESATVTRGWGMYFGQFLTNGWTSVNYARGGRDSYGGLNELWPTAKKQVEAGDYVIIQFAHNDEKNGGMDGYALKAYYERVGNTAAAAAVDLRGSVPSTTYKDNLRKLVAEVQAAGANPILVGAVCRSYFTGAKIRRNGRHDLGDSYSLLTESGVKEKQSLPATDHTMDYTYQMQQLAGELQVPFVDLTQATADLYESYGDAKCHEYLFDGAGSTHFNTTGALLVARLCAQLMKEQGILADAINVPTDLSVSPADGDLGQAYRGQTLVKEFTVNGFGLQPATGVVTVTASEGVKLSTDKQTWQQQLSLDYNASTLVKTVYAQLTLEQSGETTGTVTVSQGEKTIEIALKATAVSMEGGSDVTAYWRLESNADCTLDGPATVVDESWTGMYVQRYANPNAKTEWPDWTGYDASRKMQRNLLEGDNWPADEIDDNPQRYIEFGIAPNKGNELKIDSIGFFICGAGGNGMMCHAYYSTDEFETRTTIYAPTKMVANNPVAVEAQPVVSLGEGQRLLVRIYPWYNGAASGKTICISDVTIHGKAFDATTGLPALQQNPYVVSADYYSAGGQRLSQPCRGLNIVCQKRADGSVTTVKTIK